MSANGGWIDHFPDNFTWSNATLVCKGMAPWGVVAIEEIDRVGARLKQRAAEPHAWWEEWSAMAANLERTADAADAEGRQFTAGNYYLRAGNYYFTGERFVPPGELKLGLYNKALRCFHAGLERRYPQIERVDVPYENTALPAYFMPAAGAAGRAPTIVLFDGLDNCKEMSVIFAGIEFAQRGFNTLAIDGPGQGEALRLRRIHSRHDYEVAGTAAYDFVAARRDVDPRKVVVMAYSFGGYYAPRIAAFEKRYAACIAFGAMHWDLHVAQLKRKQLLQTHPQSIAQSAFQFPWVLGAKDMDEAIEWARRFTLEKIADKIACPFLVTHGANDRLTPPDCAEKIYAAVGSKDKTIKIFTVDEGGAEHCHVDNRQVGIDYVADWIAAALKLPAR